MNAGASTYAADSPWWVFERMQRLVAADPVLAERVRPRLRALQAVLFADAAAAETEAESLLAAGATDEARALLRRLVDDAGERALALAGELTTELLTETSPSGNPVMTEFWSELNAQAGLPAASLITA